MLPAWAWTHVVALNGRGGGPAHQSGLAEKFKGIRCRLIKKNHSIRAESRHRFWPLGDLTCGRSMVRGPGRGRPRSRRGGTRAPQAAAPHAARRRPASESEEQAATGFHALVLTAGRRAEH